MTVYKLQYTKGEALLAKFEALKLIVKDRPEMLTFVERKEPLARKLVASGADRRFITGFHKELKTWVSELLEGDELTQAKVAFAGIDQRTGK